MNKLICRPRAPGGCKSPQLCGQPVTLLRGARSGSRSSQRAGAGAGSRPAAPRRGTAGLSRSPPQDGAPAGRVSLPPGRGGLCLPQSPLCVWGWAAERQQPPLAPAAPRPHSPLPALPPHGSQELCPQSLLSPPAAAPLTRTPCVGSPGSAARRSSPARRSGLLPVRRRGPAEGGLRWAAGPGPGLPRSGVAPAGGEVREGGRAGERVELSTGMHPLAAAEGVGRRQASCCFETGRSGGRPKSAAYAHAAGVPGRPAVPPRSSRNGGGGADPALRRLPRPFPGAL